MPFLSQCAVILLAVSLTLNVVYWMGRLRIRLTDRRRPSSNVATEYPYCWDFDDYAIDDIEYSIAGGEVSVRYCVWNTRDHGACSLDNPLLAFQRGVSLPVVKPARPVTLLRGSSVALEARFRLLWDDEPIVFQPVESKENQ